MKQLFSEAHRNVSTQHVFKQGPDLQNILRQSYDYLTIMPKLRSTYDGHLHRESIKNKTINSSPQLPQMLTDFQNSFNDKLTGKFATNLSLNIPPH